MHSHSSKSLAFPPAASIQPLSQDLLLLKRLSKPIPRTLRPTSSPEYTPITTISSRAQKFFTMHRTSMYPPPCSTCRRSITTATDPQKKKNHNLSLCQAVPALLQQHIYNPPNAASLKKKQMNSPSSRPTAPHHILLPRHLTSASSDLILLFLKQPPSVALLVEQT